MKKTWSSVFQTNNEKSNMKKQRFRLANTIDATKTILLDIEYKFDVQNFSIHNLKNLDRNWAFRN